MSKFKSFLNQFNNQSVEVVDASNKYQCFDLAVAWLDWLGLPRTFNHLYAYSIYENATDGTKANFTLYPNSPDFVPLEGDVAVWGKAYNGTAGHVGICTGEGNTDWFNCFVQNDPLGSVSHVKKYSYGAISGFLRPKVYQYDEIEQEDSWKKSHYDRVISGLFQRELLETSDSNHFKDNESDTWIGIDWILADREALATDLEQEKGKVEKLIHTIELKDQEIKHNIELADSEKEKALAEMERDCQRSCDLTLEKRDKIIDNLNKILKEGVEKVEIKIETPLADRFRGKTWKDKWLAVFEILGA